MQGMERECDRSCNNVGKKINPQQAMKATESDFSMSSVLLLCDDLQSEVSNFLNSQTVHCDRFHSVYCCIFS